MFTRIVVPLDGSRMSEAALPLAERIARAFGAALSLLHVLERGAHSTVHGDRHFTDPAEARTYLQALADGLGARGIATSVHVHDTPEPDAAASIASHGAEESADLIVLCTHGRSGVRGFLWGSIAQRVLQQGTTPVLLVRAPRPQPALADTWPATVLVPLDATAAAEAALQPAAELARKLDARLRLTMVVATLDTIHDDRRAASVVMPQATRRILDLEEEQAQQYLDGLIRRLGDAGVAVDGEVRRGDTVAQLAGAADEQQADLVVVATHGRAGLQAIWTGSTVARLLARTGAPVLLLRLTEH